MYALILGGTGPQSLGRHIAIAMHNDGIKPILIGRSATKMHSDPELPDAICITADLMDHHVAKHVVEACADMLSSIAYVLIAGGGPHLRGSLNDHPIESRRQLWRTIVEGPMEVVASFHGATTHAYHLMTIASTSAKVVRADETIYAAAQAARRSFSLHFQAELSHRPSSKNLVVCPGGMKTGLWHASSADTTMFLDPKTVAKIIWSTAQQQQRPLEELTVWRNADGSPNIEKEVPLR